MKKSLKYGTGTIITIILFLGILVVLNLFSLKYFFRIDLTENKEYTLSDSTIKILKGLDDIISIKVYFSKKLPPYMNTLRQKVKDIITDYKNYGGDKVHVEYIDPGDDPATVHKMRTLGIPRVQLNIIEKDKAQIVNAYLGIGIFFEDKKEVIPLVKNVRTLEYDLTRAILKVSQKKLKKVGFIIGDEMKGRTGNINGIKNIIGKQYNVVTLSDKKKLTIPNDIKTLIVIGGQGITDAQLFAIDQFIMKGGKVIFCVDPVIINEQYGLRAFPADSKLFDLIYFYGVKINKALVLDRSNAMAAFSSGFIQFQIPYPFWVRVTKSGFDKTNPIVAKLESLVLPWTAPLSLRKDLNKKNLNITHLVKSSSFAWKVEKYFNISPQQKFNPLQKDLHSFDLAVLLKGKFTSYFTDKPIPKPKEENKKNQKDKNKEEQGKNEEKEKKEKEIKVIKKGKEAYILVIGNGNFITNSFLERFPSNIIFFLNSVDWLTMGDQLIGIRSRASVNRPLVEISDNKKSMIRYINMFAIPFLVVIFGLIKYGLRRRRRRRNRNEA